MPARAAPSGGEDPHCWPIPPGRDDFQIPQVLGLTRRDGHIAEQLAVASVPRIRGARPVLEAGNQPTDAEAADAIGPDVPGQDPLLGGPLREGPVDAHDVQIRTRLAIVVDDAAGDRHPRAGAGWSKARPRLP